MTIAESIRRHMADSSWIRRMFEIGITMKRERGEENVFDLSLGNPVMEPPPEFDRELRRLVNAPPPGMHRYMPNAGYTETRQAVAVALAAETGLAYEAAHVMMCVGAGGGINVALHALLDPGDEVLILAPFFAEYLFYAYNHQGVPVVVGCNHQFEPDLAELKAKITPRTKALLLNSPNNPSGAVYSAQIVAQVAEVLGRKAQELGTQPFIISDEPYRKLIFDGLTYPFPQHYYQRTITVTSHSKDLALPGERIGYVAVHPDYPDSAELMDAMIFCNRVLGFVNAPALMQHVVRTLQNVTVDVADYQRKRDFLYGHLTHQGYRVMKPQGAFYMFPESPMNDEMQIVEALQRHGVLVVPGRGFGLPGHFRISFCVEDRVLEGAVAGFAAVAQELGAAEK
jgi:aspartate aminotransferase